LYIHTQTDHQPQFSGDHIYFLAKLPWNGTHRIVGYQRQWRIELCCLQKHIRWKILSQSLDSDVPCTTCHTSEKYAILPNFGEKKCKSYM